MKSHCYFRTLAWSRGLVWFTIVTASTVLINQHVAAAEQAMGVLFYQQGAGGVFHYDIDVKDSGTTNIGTLWYGWVPGKDFLGLSPTNLAAPAGWQVHVTNTGATDGFAVQWINNSGPLAAGQTLSGFSFDSTESPAVLMGNSQFFSGTPISTTFIYGGAPFSDAGFQFNIDPATHLWQNPFASLDVNNDGLITQADVNLVVNGLVASGIRTLGIPTVGSTLPRFVDTTGDGLLSPGDLLDMLNQVDGPAAHAASVLGHPLASSAVATAAVPEPGGRDVAIARRSGPVV